MNRDEMAILRAVVYASLFDYPLTLEQLHQTLIARTLTLAEILTVFEASPRLQSAVWCRDGFFFPAGRHDLLAERREREARSREFLARHSRTLALICVLPFTRLVALSGSVAHLNLDQGGDLDLFIVTRGRTVWMVTVAVILLTRLLGVRRAVCANFIMSDEHLALEQQDLFTANQVLHLKPIIGEDVFEGLLAANPFVRRFYPNGTKHMASSFVASPGFASRALKRTLERLLGAASPLVEALCRRAYGWHLHRRARCWRSPDQVRLQPDCLKLHTRSHRHSVLARFDQRVADALGHGDQAAIA